MNINFTSDRDVREQIVLPALGQFADDHDVDSIVSETILGWDEKGHAILVDEDTFWHVVKRHAF
jgi:hypothetical protein